MSKVEFKNISKRFGSFLANDDISFGISGNTVHCIVGENGAGKSTLMNILFGLMKPDSGEIIIADKPVVFSSPHEAITSKIGMVHQHFMLIDDFTVLENVILGDEPVTLIFHYNLDINSSEKVTDLSISMQQKVEILKLLYRDSEILIFDEPTAVLSPVEVSSFFKMITSFKESGKTVIVITHKLNEVREIADKVSVLRKGRLVYEADNVSGNIDINELSKAIIGGAELIKIRPKSNSNSMKKPLLRLVDVSLVRGKRKMLDGLSLELFNGEILGIAGVEGNGQSELADIVCGIEREFTGTVELPDERASIVPDDRLKKGMIKEFSIGENLVLKKDGNSLHRMSTLRKASEEVIAEYEVRAPGPDIKTGSLSGGNQQKVVIAREIASGRSVMIFSHPTRGVDINAEMFIHSEIVKERNKGKAILLISSDMEELLSLSDRLSVIYKGKIERTFDSNELYAESQMPEQQDHRKEMLINEIGKLMTGVSN
ncbi:MAG: ABC transporter ATP-binding protein [Ignavibacteria bacterium]|nr:ABC transporter ATP-binding protein [Ignavibacteria bacterium]